MATDRPNTPTPMRMKGTPPGQHGPRQEVEIVRTRWITEAEKQKYCPGFPAEVLEQTEIGITAAGEEIVMVPQEAYETMRARPPRPGASGPNPERAA